jgi:hypothetical protein
MAAGQGHRLRPPRAGKGRPKGSKNKLTLSVKEAFEHARLDSSKDPGTPGVKRGQLGEEGNPTEFYKRCGQADPAGREGGVDHKVTAPELAVIASALGLPVKK